MINNISILVTGGAGFIGSHIVDELVLRGYKHIRVLDNLSTGNKNNIQQLIEQNKIEFMYGTIEDMDTCRTAVDGMDMICHQAALGSVPRSITDPIVSHKSNVDGFINLLNAAREQNIKRIVYASSSSVYGDNENLPKIESIVGSVCSPYAATKKINEIYAGVFTKCYGMEIIGLRYFNVFGPRQNPDGAYAAVIPKFMKYIKEGKRPIINGTGNYSRDFTYVSNVVHANMQALSCADEYCYGNVFNIGSGGRVTIMELFNSLKQLLKQFDLKPIQSVERIGDVPHSNANIDRAKNFLGYNPEVSFYDGLLLLVDADYN